MNELEHLRKLRVALVYDHLTTLHGGAEIVLEELTAIFPNAPIFTSVSDLSKESPLKKKKVFSSFLQYLGPLKKFHQVLAFLHPLAFESFDFKDFDIIISVSNGAAKGVVTLPSQLHVEYLLTPTRFLYINKNEERQYFKSHKIVLVPGLKSLLRPIFDYLRRWDQVASWRPDKIIAISKLVADRTQSTYRREVDSIIYPPYQIADRTDEVTSKPYLLCISRLASYKRIDLAIRSAIRLNKTLIIVGSGVFKKELEKVADPNIYFRKNSQTLDESLKTAIASNKNIIFWGSATPKEKVHILQNATTLLMPGEEDFGLAGLEAVSMGVPVITYTKSGISEVLTENKNAVFLTEQTEASLNQAIQKVEKSTWNKDILSQSVEEFDSQSFRKRFSKTIYQFWLQHSTISSVR